MNTKPQDLPQKQSAPEAPIPPGGGSYELQPDGTLSKREGTKPADSKLGPVPASQP